DQRFTGTNACYPGSVHCHRTALDWWSNHGKNPTSRVDGRHFGWGYYSSRDNVEVRISCPSWEKCCSKRLLHSSELTTLKRTSCWPGVVSCTSKSSRRKCSLSSTLSRSSRNSAESGVINL